MATIMETLGVPKRKRRTPAPPQAQALGYHLGGLPFQYPMPVRSDLTEQAPTLPETFDPSQIAPATNYFDPNIWGQRAKDIAGGLASIVPGGAPNTMALQKAWEAAWGITEPIRGFAAGAPSGIPTGPLSWMMELLKEPETQQRFQEHLSRGADPVSAAASAYAQSEEAGEIGIGKQMFLGAFTDPLEATPVVGLLPSLLGRASKPLRTGARQAFSTATGGVPTQTEYIASQLARNKKVTEIVENHPHIGADIAEELYDEVNLATEVLTDWASKNRPGWDNLSAAEKSANIKQAYLDAFAKEGTELIPGIDNIVTDIAEGAVKRTKPGAAPIIPGIRKPKTHKITVPEEEGFAETAWPKDMIPGDQFVISYGPGGRNTAKYELMPDGTFGKPTYTGPHPGVANRTRFDKGEDFARGEQALKERMDLEERLTGSLDPESRYVADEFLDMLPDHMIEDLGSSYRKVISESEIEGALKTGYAPTAATYEPDIAIINIFKTIESGVVAGSERTIVHEIAHHLEQFVPSAEAKKLVSQFNREMSDRGQSLIDELTELRKSKAGEARDVKIREKAVKAGELTPELWPLPKKVNPLTDAEQKLLRDSYRYTNFKEWFAEVMTDKALRDILMEIPEKRNVIQKVLDAIKELAVGVYNTLLRRGATRDEAEKVYKNLINNKFDPAERRPLYDMGYPLEEQIPFPGTGGVPMTDMGPTVFHGTRGGKIESFLDADGNLVLQPSTNFEGRQVGVSFTGDRATAQDYATRFSAGEAGGAIAARRQYGGFIFEIDRDAIPDELFMEAADELATRSTNPVVIPKGKFKVSPVDEEAQSALQAFEREGQSRVRALSNSELGTADLYSDIEGEMAEHLAGGEFSGWFPYEGSSLTQAEWDIADRFGFEAVSNPIAPWIEREILRRMEGKSPDELTKFFKELGEGAEALEPLHRNAPFFYGPDFETHFRKTYGDDIAVPAPSQAPSPATGGVPGTGFRGAGGGQEIIGREAEIPPAYKDPKFQELISDPIRKSKAEKLEKLKDETYPPITLKSNISAIDNETNQSILVATGDPDQTRVRAALGLQNDSKPEGVIDALRMVDDVLKRSPTVPAISGNLYPRTIKLVTDDNHIFQVSRADDGGLKIRHLIHGDRSNKAWSDLSLSSEQSILARADVTKDWLDLFTKYPQVVSVEDDFGKKYFRNNNFEGLRKAPSPGTGGIPGTGFRGAGGGQEIIGGRSGIPGIEGGR